MNLQNFFNEKISAALHQLGVSEKYSAIVKPSLRAKFGDYQANGIMVAAKSLGRNPIELAAQVVNNIDLGDLVSKVEIAKPGFINIFLDDTGCKMLDLLS